MKNFLKYFLLSAISSLPLFSLALVNQAHAATACPSNLSALSSIFPTAICDVNSLIMRVISIIFSLIGIVSALFIIIGGFRMVTSQGNEKSVGAAKKTITYAVIGLVVSIMAYTIIAIVVNTVGAPAAVPTGGESNTNTGSQNGSGSGTTNTTADCSTAGVINFQINPQPTPGVPQVTMGQSFDIAVSVGNPDINAGKCNINMQILSDTGKQFPNFNGVTKISSSSLSEGPNTLNLVIYNTDTKQIIGTASKEVQVDPVGQSSPPNPSSSTNGGQ